MSGIVMAESKKRNLYFLDSFVTAKSVCREIANKMKVKFAKRDVFLDNQDNPVYIKQQLMKLKNLARKSGVAIAIGHDRKNTLKVLKEMLPVIESEGYKFVFVSEIAK
ncbi:MAG: divergent polysaccharide deacetylase family protein, partial [Candidatus Omnitrophota bacterium]|nr:divergent polysaccharide deacetylase family protein [Candidatus Omnitrophota bacterium]